MGLKGAVLGGVMGSFIGPLGTLFGSIAGSWLEETMKTDSDATARQTTAQVFCASAAAMLAKMAKSDGRITRDEITVVEQAFRQLGFSGATRAFAVKVFRKAKDDAHSIYEYAADFARAVPNLEVRVLFYELLWDLACADGIFAPEENAILRRITVSLGIPSDYYFIFARDYLRDTSFGSSSGSGRARGTPPPSAAEDEVAAAYRQLGVSPSASDAEIKKAYRELAKKYHPDALRAQGLPEEMIGKATERMAKINAAWATIKEQRKL